MIDDLVPGYCAALRKSFEEELGMNHDEYNAALTEIDTLFNSEPGTPEAERLTQIVVEVEEYESEHYPIERPRLLAYWWYSFQMHKKSYLLKRALGFIRTALWSLWGDSGGEVEL